MKLSYTYATPETRATNILALRGDPDASFAYLASCGYQGVELMVRDVRELDPATLLDAARNNGLKICAVSTGQLRAEDGLNLSDLDDANRKAAVVRCCEAVDFSSAIGVQVNIGSLRGVLPATRRAEALDLARESFDQIFAHAARRDVLVAVEPQHRYMINWLNNVPQTLKWINSFNTGQARIVFDVYHWMLEERDIIESLILAAPWISHVQVSDSHRGIPGTGHTNLAEIVKVLAAIGYDGYVSVEAAQHPDSHTVARMSASYLLRMLNDMAQTEIPKAIRKQDNRK